MNDSTQTIATDASQPTDAGHHSSAQPLSSVLELYERGRYIDAMKLGESLGPLAHWTTADGRVIAGRLANNLGAPRLGRALHWLALRNYPTHPHCMYYGAMAYWSRFGVLRAWRRFRNVSLPDIADNRVQADWLAMKAMMLASMRDFSRADKLLIDALELDPNSAWLHVELCEILDRQDLHEDALRAAREALNLQPWFRPAIQSAGHKLVQLRRDDEALALLTEATTHLQSGDVWCQLGLLQQELKQYDAAWNSFLEAEKLWPLASADSHHKQWLAGQRSDIAYYRGDYKRAAELAREVDRPFYKQLVERLEVAIAEPPPREPRVQLPVPFIRQHHETCAPATLTSLAQYWQKPIKHEEVVERICYEGTQSSDERRWAEENGFYAREFRITSDSADALIRAGVPFTLNTVEPNSAHLQAIVGIDDLRGTFLIQDPSERHVGEVSIDKLLERYASSGPRGMVMVPIEERQRIEAIELPEAELYDLHYQVDRALADHVRAKAVEAIEAMLAIDRDHRLTLQSRVSLARYDGNQVELLSLVDELLKQFPDDANLHLIRLSCLGEFGRRDQRIELLRERCSGSKSHPIFWTRLASELMDDARDQPEAEWYLRAATRYSHLDGRTLGLYASLLWGREERDEALELYRLAASTNEKDESRACSYFSAARYMRQTDLVLEWLEDRKQRFGARSSLPGRTLAWAYEQLEQTQRGLDLLASTVEQHPDDGDLLCHYAATLGRYNRPELATPHLAAARGKTSESNYLRSAAALASYEGKISEARELYRQVLAIEPLDSSTRERLLRLDMDLDGNEVAEQNLRAAIAEYPHSNTLRVMLIQWLRSNRIAAVKEELDRYLADNPHDSWAQREASIVAILHNDLPTARKLAEQAVAADPYSDVSHFLLGRVFEKLGDVAAARAKYREAIRLNVDHETAISMLIETCDRPKDRNEQLEFVYQQLEQQTTFGDGVLAFRSEAHGKLEPDQLLAKLERALEKRPDLWHCYSAVIQQLMAMNQRDKAVAVATQATERFPLLPRVWVDLAIVHRARGDSEAELASLLRARDINPHWSEVARELSDTYLNRKQFEEAEAVVRKVLAADPRDAQSLAGLADCLYKAGKKAEAFAPLKQACLQQIDYHWAWQSLNDWSREFDGGATARETAEQIARERPLDARAYLRIAESLDDLDRFPDSLKAIDRALELDPRNVDAHVRKAYYLGRLHRWDEALEACSPPIFGAEQPVALQMRRAYMYHRKGQLGEAIQAMQNALESDPDHYGAWSQLADWAEEARRDDIYLLAAQNMVRTDPHQPVPRGYLADALLRDQTKRATAIEHLETALRLSPDYYYATMRLIDLYLEDNLPAEALRVLAIGGDHVPDGQQPSLKLRIAAHQGLVDDSGQYLAIQDLVALCRLESPPAQGPITRAVDSFGDAIAIAATARLTEELKRTPELAPAGIALGRLLARTKDKKQLVKSVRAVPFGNGWNECVRVLLRSLAHFEHKSDSLDLLRTTFGKQMKRNTGTWSAVGSTMLDYGQTEQVVQWTRDWQKREGLSGMDLIPGVASRWESFKLPEARRMVAFALKLESDSAASLHHVWAGLDALMHGNGESAIHHAQQVAHHELVGWYPIAYSILVAGCELWPDGRGGRKLDETKKLITALTAKQFDLGPFAGDRLTHWILARIRAALAKAHRARWLALKNRASSLYIQLF